MASITKKKIIEAVERGLSQSALEFERIVNAGKDNGVWTAKRMPESWILTSVMSEIRSLNACMFPEVRAKQDFPSCCDNGVAWTARMKRMPTILDGTKKLDLVVGVPFAERSDLVEVVAAMELKGPKANWSSLRPDIERLQALQPCFESDKKVRIFGYIAVQAPGEKFADYESKYFDNTGLSPQSVQITSVKLSQERLSHTFMYWF